MSKQIFGSALTRPWALVKWGGDQPNGRRPSTTVAYLTDPIKDEAGTVVGYDGGLVEHYRPRSEPRAGWHFRYKRPRKFSAADICCFLSAGKARDPGPTQWEIKQAKKAVPKNPVEVSQ